MPTGTRSEEEPAANRQSIDQTIDRAVRALRARIPESGEIPVYTSFHPDFRTPHEPDPSIFPTALAAQALAECPEAADLAERCRAFLSAERDRTGGWSHWPRHHPLANWLPPDLDDTACAADALRDATQSESVARLLLGNRRRDGLFLTWIIPRFSSIQALGQMMRTGLQLRKLPGLVALFRKTSARPGDVDAVVNANCLNYLGDRPETWPVRRFILRVILEEREAVCDKWYDDEHAVRYFFSRALARGGMSDAERASLGKRTQAAIAKTPLQLACKAITLVHCGVREPSIARRLASLQRLDGLWDAAALYHGGRLRDRTGRFLPKHPDTPHWGSEELTTALCVEAMSRLRAAIP